MPNVKRGTRPPSATGTRERLVSTTAGLLATGGFAGATTRAIGEAAGCNPALIAYHFGSLNQLLLAALDDSSQRRLTRYRAEVARARNLKDLRRTVRRLYREDRASGHVTILAEMVAGGLMDRELGAEVAARVEPWVDLAEAALRDAVPTPALRRRAPARQIAHAVVALFLGLEVLGQLAGDHAEGDAVVHRLTSTGPLWRQAGSPEPA